MSTVEEHTAMEREPQRELDASGSGESPAAPTPRIPRMRALLAHQEVRRFWAFLVAGGLSALVTLTVTAVLTDLVGQRFLWAALLGTEAGILVNFGINDRQAFHDLAGHHRALPVRLVRYHLTCAVGQTLILLIALVLHDVLHWGTVFAQAVPIGLVTGVNFALHRWWTYRGARATAEPVQPRPAAALDRG